MTVPSLTLLIVAGVLVGAGVYLLLERTLTRIFIGLSLMTHGINVLILASGGPAGRPPLLGGEDPAAMADPLPQAMMLTSIVLSLGTTAFGLALAYRSWKLSGHDEVVDDIEDRVLAQRAERASALADDEAATGTEDAGIDYDTEDTEADLRADGLDIGAPDAQEPTAAGEQRVNGGGA
ncbi:MAG: Na(+)/H(+) antiporter subunit C [Actinomyces sp.]|jgi:multicomponent Na+:H+ antiporter subunit C|nr:Na(+)/H(+) antiporter subunit C [Actinomyces sp.]MCI1641812.1 Na(+)/H(+) antiporter subunit C [Actinomyces sp.]MCI1661991.1 Na(+)/H(+) antiporter subunit C [Actinomyces sp.]MCI1690809.1 Na(+)/H(+) antiporter subunit C [Actinomyces sp.]MCI1787307.1 Na(+)/H(+) antiporter subunit C [Actinomyces sp.]MCI1866399.1 Na(+)/H(+) antiporter subunit C [Actinomyces sp.]